MNRIIFTDKNGNKHVKDFHHEWWMENKVNARNMLERTPDFIKADVMGKAWNHFNWEVITTITKDTEN